MSTKNDWEISEIFGEIDTDTKCDACIINNNKEKTWKLNKRKWQMSTKDF